MHRAPDQATVRVTIKATGNVTHRLMRGFGANALGPVVTAIIQLGSVPIFLHAWGAAKYGDWLLLSAIPSYLSFSDLGFGDASGSDMCMRVAANDREGALETFQSSWVLVTCVSLVVLLLASASAWWIPWQPWLRLSSLVSHQAATIIMVLGAYIVLAQQNGVADSGFTSDGHYATSTFWRTILRLAEAVTATTVVILHGSLLAVALTYLLVRCVGTISFVFLLRKMSPWIHYGIRYARLATIKQLAAPAFGFMAFPVGYALNLQGLILVVGARLGPVAVVSFSTLRTLSRLSFQVIGVIKTPLWPELSRAFGEGKIALARRLHRHACQAALGLSILGGSLLWIIGPFVYRLWIRHGVSFDASCFHVLLLVVVTNSLWDTSSVIPMSINAHCRIALAYSAAAMVSLGLAWMLVTPLGAVGAAVALFATDGWMTWLVLRTSLRHVQDDLRKFVAAMFSVPQFRRPTLQAAPNFARSK
jgi:O-antigen/teichoic acid export membrane protein